MASRKQRRAAKQNVKKAQEAARQKKTIANLPEETRKDLSREAAKSRKRGGEPGHALEERTRDDLYERAKDLDIEGRSKMGKSELIDAIRDAQ